eukprot:6448374-Ditylum_brightwellii.AAC.1
MELSVMTGVGGWGWPISSRAKRNSSPLHMFTYSAPISASAVLDITLCMTMHTVCKGPFGSGCVAGSLFKSADAGLK